MNRDIFYLQYLSEQKMFSKRHIYYSVAKIKNIIFRDYYQNSGISSKKRILYTFYTAKTNKFQTNNKLVSDNFRKDCIRNFSIHSNTLQELSPNQLKKYLEMEKEAKFRLDPVVTTLDTPQFKSIFTQHLKDLLALFEKYGYEIRIAGGAVR